ncbi:MAG: hypothetical protein PHW95_02910 [Patescibacteria group bacterium]|nr:hypothetical protein [Patescibacteria group bacterium]
MGEPARKISVEDLNGSMESLDRLVPRDNIVDFNKYKQEKQHQRNLQAARRQDQLAQNDAPADEAENDEDHPATASLSNKKSQPLKNTAAETRHFPRTQGATPEKTNPAGLTGDQNANQAASDNQNDAPADEDENDENQPQTRAQQAQQNLDQQRKALGQKTDKKDNLKKQYNQQTQEKNWRRHLTGRKLRQAEKDTKKTSQAIQKLEQTVSSLTGTGEILKQAWLNLPDSFGLSYFYIPLHYLLAYFTPLSIFFCKFGEEWIPKKAKTAGGKAGEKLSKIVELLEVIGCFFLGFLWLIVIFAVILLVAVIAYVWLHPLDTLYQVTGFSWDFIKCIGGHVFGVGTCGGIISSPPLPTN